MGNICKFVRIALSILIIFVKILASGFESEPLAKVFNDFLKRQSRSKCYFPFLSCLV